MNVGTVVITTTLGVNYLSLFLACNRFNSVAERLTVTTTVVVSSTVGDGLLVVGRVVTAVTTETVDDVAFSLSDSTEEATDAADAV